MAVAPILLIAAVGATAVVGVMAAKAQTKAAQSQADFNTRKAENNAVIAEKNRERALAESRVAAQDSDQAARSEIGQVVANAAASGLSISSGSKAQQRVSLEKLVSRDRERLVLAGTLEAQGLTERASQARAEAANSRKARKFAAKAGQLQAANSLVSAGKFFLGAS